VNQLNLLSKYRAQLMGIAILMIVFLHMTLEFGTVVTYFKSLCEAGVDIFLLVSGFGLYYSLNKNNDTLEFYKRRLSRLAPAYIPFIILRFLLLFITSDVAENKFSLIQTFSGNVVMTGFLSGLEHQFNWYVQAIFWFYLFTPIFYSIISSGSPKERNKRVLILFAIIIIINITFFSNGEIIIGLSRLFIFILGIVFADCKKREENIKNIFPVALIFMIIGIAIWLFCKIKLSEYCRSFGLAWYPFFFITPGLCMIFCKCFDTLNNNKIGMKINSFLSVLGGASFEIYLVHISLNTIIKKFEDMNCYVIFCVGMNLVSIILGIIYSKIIGFIYPKFVKIISKSKA